LIREAPQLDSFRSDISKPSDFFSKLLEPIRGRSGDSYPARHSRRQ
jgi:hypothetical protein